MKVSSIKKVLLISSRFPFPPVGGDKLKTYNLIKILNKHYDISFVCMTDEKLNGEQLEYCQDNFQHYYIFKKSKYKSILNAFKAFFTKRPLQVEYYHFNDVQETVNNEAEKCDFVINVLIRTSEYTRNISSPVFLDMVDSISLNYNRSRKNVKSLFWKLIYNIEYKRLSDYEKLFVEKSVNTLFVNDIEAKYWSNYGTVSWIPNGVSEHLFNYAKKSNSYEDCISFIGKMDYQPNIDSVVWFVNKVLPLLNKKIKFLIVGANPTKSVLSLASNQVVVTGFVDDPYLFLRNSFACVAPMQTGGGIQNKILETMALGKITIATTLGASPIIGAEDGEHIIIEDNPLKMALKINNIYLNKDHYHSIGVNAKKLVEVRYTWKAYEEKLLEVIKSSNI